LGAIEPKFWQKFCNLMGHPEWGGRLMEKELVTEVGDMFQTQSMKYWTDKLEHQEVCLSPVLTVKEAAEHSLFQGGFPQDFGGAKMKGAPKLGAHNQELLDSSH
jgi:crotonobetainyl-CoA:carnitine CoA-transferase CaiB-like acyl-CoA transferase